MAKLLESTKRNFTLVDFVLFRDVAFNPTISKRSKKLPTMASIRKMLVIAGATNERPLNLYHCVNESQFNKKSFSNAFLPKHRTPEDVAFLEERLRQYVLCIPASRPKLHDP